MEMESSESVDRSQIELIFLIPKILGIFPCSTGETSYSYVAENFSHSCRINVQTKLHFKYAFAVYLHGFLNLRR